MKITYERLKIMNPLREGAQSWTTLRVAYYGEERAKSAASTSFNNQLHRMMTGGLIEKCVGGYKLTAEGEERDDIDGEHPCARCTTMIPVEMGSYCVGCQEDRKAGHYVEELDAPAMGHPSEHGG
jgi:hypothetical protein